MTPLAEHPIILPDESVYVFRIWSNGAFTQAVRREGIKPKKRSYAYFIGLPKPDSNGHKGFIYVRDYSTDVPTIAHECFHAAFHYADCHDWCRWKKEEQIVEIAEFLLDSILSKLKL